MCKIVHVNLTFINGNYLKVSESVSVFRSELTFVMQMIITYV